jgi:hypothetical protein
MNGDVYEFIDLMNNVCLKIFLVLTRGQKSSVSLSGAFPVL